MECAAIERRAFIFHNLPIGIFIRWILYIQLLTKRSSGHHLTQAVQRLKPDLCTGSAFEQCLRPPGPEREREVGGPAIANAMIFPARIIIQHVIYEDDADLRAS